MSLLRSRIVEIALVIDAAEIAGAQPAVLHRVRGRVRIAPVARHGHRALHQDLADIVLSPLSGGASFTVDIAERPPAGEQQVFAAGARLAMIVRRQAGHHAGFGRAVALREIAGEGRGRALQRRGRHGRGRIEHHAQRRQIERTRYSAAPAARGSWSARDACWSRDGAPSTSSTPCGSNCGMITVVQPAAKLGNRWYHMPPT